MEKEGKGDEPKGNQGEEEKRSMEETTVGQ